MSDADMQRPEECFISLVKIILVGISWSLISPHHCHHLSVFSFSQFLKTCHFHLVIFTFPIYFMCSIPSQPFSFNLTLPLSLSATLPLSLFHCTGCPHLEYISFLNLHMYHFCCASLTAKFCSHLPFLYKWNHSVLHVDTMKLAQCMCFSP